MQRYTQEQIEACLKDAWSYENREGWGAENLDTEYVGTVRRGKELNDLYVDTEGNYWFKTRIITDSGVISAHESIFGYSELEWERMQQRRKRRKWK